MRELTAVDLELVAGKSYREQVVNGAGNSGGSLAEMFPEPDEGNYGLWRFSVAAFGPVGAFVSMFVGAAVGVVVGGIAAENGLKKPIVG